MKIICAQKLWVREITLRVLNSHYQNGTNKVTAALTIMILLLVAVKLNYLNQLFLDLMLMVMLIISFFLLIDALNDVSMIAQV